MKIIELSIKSKDLAQTEAFYNKVLELPIISKTDKRIAFQIGDSCLSIEQSETEISPIYHYAFNIPSNKLEEAYTWLSNRVELIKDESGNDITDFELWHAKSIYFYDNNRNILEFICRRDLNVHAALPFDMKQILNISEVGLATEDPLAFAEDFIAKTAATYFVKGPRRVDFTAIGDEIGLLVVANTKRNWYPTQIPASQYPMELLIQVNDREFVFKYI